MDVAVAVAVTVAVAVAVAVAVGVGEAVAVAVAVAVGVGVPGAANLKLAMRVFQAAPLVEEKYSFVCQKVRLSAGSILM